MKEANIAEITKRNILSNASYICEICGTTLGYGREEKRPQFYFIIPIMQGGEKKETNVAVLCPSDGERFKEIDRDLLLRKAMYREMAEPDS